jgi:hypothetical protein
MNSGTRLHMIFLIILILATTMVVLLFRNKKMSEGFGNEILDIQGAEYGDGKNNGSVDYANQPLSPMDPGSGFYAFNVGTIDKPQWKRKSVPYGYRRDPTDLTELVPVSESAIATATPGLNDAELIAPPFLQIPGALYTGDDADYGVDKKPPASGFYKIKVIDSGTSKYYMKNVPNGYVVDRKDLLVDNVNPGANPGSKNYTKLVYQAPEIPTSVISNITGLESSVITEISADAVQSDTAWDGDFIINSGGTYYKKLIPNGYDISSNDPAQTEYKKLPPNDKDYTPLKYNPNFTPDKYDPKFTYDAKNTDKEYRDASYGKTDDVNRGKYWMFDEEGKLIEVNTEMNKSPILYYIPGAYKFGASNYVPTYEDSVYLSRTTRESQLAPVVNTASQLGGFCSQYATNTAALEEKCAAQDLNACASTSCCVLLGGQKCVTGNENGPKNPANYTDYSLMNRDFYYYQGKCYGNCK